MPSRKKRKSQPLPRPPWVPSPSPEEDWGTDNDPDREWPFRVVDQEVGFNGEIKYQVAWTTWKRPDGSNTTWHAANALNGVTLPTPEWRAEREEIIRNNSTTLQGCMENDRRFGYQPPTQKELKEWREREERDIAFAKSQLSTYNAAGTSRTANPPSPPRVNAEAGPSRIIPPLSSRPAPSSSRHTPTISSSRTPLSSGPAPSSLRFSAPTASSSRVTAIKPEVIVIDDSDDESDGFVEITGFDSTQKAESPVSTSLSGKGKQRAHSRPLPPPPLVSIPLPAQLVLRQPSEISVSSTLVGNSASQGGSSSTASPGKRRRRRDQSPFVRKCPCGTILPPPDTWKHDLCDTCYPNPAKRPREDDAGASVGNEAEFQRKVKRARLGSGRSSVKLDYSPEPSQLRKGKGKATDKSLRLRIETEWSSAADKASRAASLVFINDIDDEEVPPSILGNGWEFLYLEDKYALPPSLSSVIGLGYHPATGIDCPEKYVRCECLTTGRFLGRDCVEARHCACQTQRDAPPMFAYTDGLFNFEYQPHEVVVECNPCCTCSTECGNRVSQWPRKQPIEIFKTRDKGWAVRSSEAVRKGQVLGVYTGKLIPRRQAEKLRGTQKSFCFDLDYQDSDRDGNRQDKDRLLSVDSWQQGNWTRFINHSCEPNLHVQPVVYDTIIEQNAAFLCFIAMNFIPAGTEYTFDYHSKNRDIPCMCGTENCRKFM